MIQNFCIKKQIKNKGSRMNKVNVRLLQDFKGKSGLELGKRKTQDY